MDIITVGAGKNFININDAIVAAAAGDLILIDPGVYNYSITINKVVSLVGNTYDVINNRIQVEQLNFTDIDVAMPVEIIVENIYVSHDTHYFLTVASVSEYTHIIINRCYLTVPEGAYYTLSCASYMKLDFINCTLNSGYTSTSDYVLESVARIRCLVMSTASFTNTYYQDYSFSEVVGYGVEYGYRYHKLPTKYYFQGVVTEQNLPVARAVKAFRRTDDIIMGTTTSDPVNGEYRIDTEYGGVHYLVCMDDTSGEQYNDLIRSLVVPEEDTQENFWGTSYSMTLTIDHTLVDEDLVDFTLLINLNSSSGRNMFDTSVIFDILNISYFSTRWSLQSDVGKQLHCEIVKWDLDNKKAVIWTQIPLIKSYEDTVLTLYYNNTLPSNVFNIGYSSSIVTSHLWGTDTLGVWHMTENPDSYSAVKDSSYRRSHCTPYNLGSLDQGEGLIGNYLDFSNSGYLKILNINSNLEPNMTINALVKFNDTQQKGVIFSEGEYGAGWEVGIDEGKLYSCISDDLDTHKEISTTLSGVNTTDWYMVTALVDHANSNMKLFLDGEEKAITYSTIGNYIGLDGETIGTDYLSSPYTNPLLGGITYSPLIAVELTGSGTVASGTVCAITVSGTSYFDKTGRHTFTEKTPGAVSAFIDYRRSYEGSVKNFAGDYSDDGICTQNYILIDDNASDFEFGTDDFTMSFWMNTYLYKTVRDGGNFRTVLFGDASGDMNKCITLMHNYRIDTGNGINTMELFLTIPDNSDGFILNNELVIPNLDKNTWYHIAITRYNGTIRFFLDGVVESSVFSNDFIPMPYDSGSDFAILAHSGDTVPLDDDWYVIMNGFEIIRGYARWTAPFSLTPSSKVEPDTFFPGQIDEVMLYRGVKSDMYIKIFNESIRDNLIIYS